MSIKITIEKTITHSYEARENAIVKRTPTEIVEESVSTYGAGHKKEVQFVEEFAVVEVSKQQVSRVTLLEQVIENDDDFDFGAVISAVNGLPPFQPQFVTIADPAVRFHKG